MTYITAKFINNIKWVTLEVNVPKDNIKSMKSMEQVFATVYGVYSFGFRPWEKYVEGAVESWLSFEIEGSSEGIKFYLRIPENSRNLIESAFFSQYPNVEIEEKDDYTRRLPRDLPNDEFDIFGSDILLARENAYPIKTYPDFETTLEFEEKSIDPLSVITETMSRLKDNELIWIQLLVEPAGPEWLSDAGKTLDGVMGKGGPSKKKFAGTGEFTRNLLTAPVAHPEWSGASSTEAPAPKPEPGDQDIVKAMRKKMSKRAFNSVIRFIYIDKRDEFSPEYIGSIFGAFHQFATLNMNAFRPNTNTITVYFRTGQGQ